MEKHMPKKWKIENDKFLVFHEGVGANYVANHDLGFQSKNAGLDRIAKLKESGVYDKIVAHHRANTEMMDAWTMAFGPEWAKELVEDASKAYDLSWDDKSVGLAVLKGTNQ
jgi:hypothetical protein